MPLVNPQNFTPVVPPTFPATLALPSGSSLVGFIQAGTGAVARTVQDKLRESVSAFDFMTAAAIADVQAGTLSVDTYVSLQKWLDYCVLSQKKGVLPLGAYSTSQPLLIYKWSGTAFSFLSGTIEGEKADWSLDGTYIRASRIVPTFKDTFALGIQNGRGIRIKDIAFEGKNVLTFSADGHEMMTNSNFVTVSCRDSRYSPYAAVCIDPFGTSAPADGGYPGLSAYYVASAAGSSQITFDNVSIRYFVCGVVIAPNGTTANAEDITFRMCDIAYNKVNVATCQAQSRDVNWYGGESAFALYCFDGQNYGARTGGVPHIYGCTMSGKYLFNHYNAGGSPLFATGLHAESFASIGFIGAANAGSHSPATISGNFSFADFGGIFPDHHLVSYSPVRFLGAELPNSGMSIKPPLRFYHQLNRMLAFDTCWFGISTQGEFPLAPTTGNNAYVFADLLFNGCSYADLGSRGPSSGILPLSNQMVSLQPSDMNGMTSPLGQEIRFIGGSALTKVFNGGTQNSVSLGTVTVTIGALGTATFTVADGTIVNVGDLIYTSTSVSYENQVGGTFASTSNCIGIVTIVSTNDITIVGVPQSLTTQSLALNKRWWSRYHQASVGDTHTNTTVDNVTNPSAWANGQAIKGAGIPAGAFIVSGGGTATLVISKAATATASGIRLYDADMTLLTGTAI